MFPNIITPLRKEVGRWRVKKGTEDTNFTDLSVGEPFELDDRGLAAKYLAEAGVRWTPRPGTRNATSIDLVKPKGRGYRKYTHSVEGRAVEQMRLSAKLHRLVPEMYEPIALVDESVMTGVDRKIEGATKLSDRDIYNCLVNTVKSGASTDRAVRITTTLCDLIEPWDRVGKRAVNQIEAYLPPFVNPYNSEFEYAREIISLLKLMHPNEVDKRRNKSRVPEEKDVGEVHKFEPKKDPNARPNYPIGYGLGDKWGEMSIHTEPMNNWLRPKGTKFKNGEFGALYRPLRLLTDGLGFREKHRALTGTILIDMSGSMSPNPVLIQQLVEQSPALIVAMYGGRTRTEGRLVIVAKNGRCTEDFNRTYKAHFNGANLVDGPALMWLATQKGPRVWVSDGQVTGLDNYSSTVLKAQVSAICAQHSITRADTMEAAATVFPQMQIRGTGR